MTIEEFKEKTGEAVTATFLQTDGEFVPHLVLLTTDDNIDMINLPEWLFESSTSKDFLVDRYIPAILKTVREKIKCLCFVTDSWVKKMPAKDTEHLSLSEITHKAKDLPRTEAIVIIAYTQSQTITDAYPYHRENGKIIFDEKFGMATMDSGSRFANLLHTI